MPTFRHFRTELTTKIQVFRDVQIILNKTKQKTTKDRTNSQQVFRNAQAQIKGYTVIPLIITLSLNKIQTQVAPPPLMETK